MALKIPPPPDMGRDNQKLNRWLLEIQSILNNQGSIDPSSVEGLIALFAQVDALSVTVGLLSSTVFGLQGDVTTLQGQVTTNTANIATNTADIATLIARNQILNGAGVPGAGLGSNGDLYINNTGGAGTRLYSKIAGAWVATA